MPVTALALYPASYISRLMRSSMLDVLGQDYMRTARAKGVAWFFSVFKHALRNAILPVVAYLGPLLAYTVTGSFIVPEDTYVKSAGSGSTLRKQGGVADVIQDIVSDSGVIKKKSNSYDIADVKPFGGAGASEDVHTFIDADYLWVQYSSELDKTAFCTITYSKTDKKLYVFRQEMSDETLNQAKQDLKSSDSAKVNQAQAVLSSCTKYVDASSKKGTVLANNVKSFQLQVNPADNSVAVIIGFEDTKTKETYKVTSVVGLRNSFVLKKHEWD